MADLAKILDEEIAGIDRAIAQLQMRSRNLSNLRDKLNGEPRRAPTAPAPPARGKATADLPTRILAYLRAHPDSTGREIAVALGADQSSVSRALKAIVGQLSLRTHGRAKRWRLKEVDDG